jgi:hypothetical protein
MVSVWYNELRIGEVPEWLNGTVSKTVVELVSTVGSNPTLSASHGIKSPTVSTRKRRVSRKGTGARIPHYALPSASVRTDCALRRL